MSGAVASGVSKPRERRRPCGLIQVGACLALARRFGTNSTLDSPFPTAIHPPLWGPPGSETSRPCIRSSIGTEFARAIGTVTRLLPQLPES